MKNERTTSISKEKSLKKFEFELVIEFQQKDGKISEFEEENVNFNLNFDRSFQINYCCFFKLKNLFNR